MGLPKKIDKCLARATISFLQVCNTEQVACIGISHGRISLSAACGHLVSALLVLVCTIVSWHGPRPSPLHSAVHRLPSGLFRDQYKAHASARDATARRRDSDLAAAAAPTWSPPRYTMVSLISGSPGACGFDPADFTL